MRTYPTFLLLEGAAALVVGGGEVAARKVEALLEAGASVTVVSPEISDELRGIEKKNKALVEERAYREGEAADYAVTIAATNDNAVNRLVADDARGAGRLVNVVDAPELCNFIVPSVIRRGELTVAVSTGGASPAVSRFLRERLEKQLPERIAPLLDALGAFRRRIMETVDDPQERKRILTEAVRSPHVETFLDGDEAPLKEYLKQWI